MTKLLDQAFETASALSPSAQDGLARLIMQMTTDDASIIHLTHEEELDLIEADKEIENGDFATEERMRAIWVKHTL